MRLCFIGDAGHVNLLSWVRGWVSRCGHEIHVLTFNPPCEPVDGVTVHQLATPRLGKGRYIAAIPQVRRLVRRIRPDIVVGYRMNSYGLLAVASGFHPVVLIAQGSDLRKTGQTVFSRLTAPRADLLQTWAPHMTRKVIELGGDPDRIITLPKGIDTDVFRPGAVPETPRVISTRQLRPTYQHDVILRAVARVASRRPDVRYALCGSGPSRGDLGRLADELGIGTNVAFLGAVPNTELARHLQQAQVYVSMQPDDGVSASLLEAMACGAFPIVPDNEPNRDWIEDGTNGFLVAPGDVAALAGRIEAVLADRTLRQRARDRNAEIVGSRGSLAANMAAMDRTYRNLLSRPLAAAAHV